MTQQSDEPVSAIPGHDNGHDHSHGIHVPSWVSWAIVGFGIGITAWVIIGQFVEERQARQRLAKLAHDYRVRPLLDMDKLKEWAEKQQENSTVPESVSDEAASDKVL